MQKSQSLGGLHNHRSGDGLIRSRSSLSIVQPHPHGQVPDDGLQIGSGASSPRDGAAGVFWGGMSSGSGSDEDSKGNKTTYHAGSRKSPPPPSRGGGGRPPTPPVHRPPRYLHAKTRLPQVRRQVGVVPARHGSDVVLRGGRGAAVH